MPFLGFESKPTRLQCECHSHHTRWGGDKSRNIRIKTHNSTVKTMVLSSSAGLLGYRGLRLLGYEVDYTDYIHEKASIFHKTLKETPRMNLYA
ncbi:hypothetical protein TNCV_2037491 [Trichonephila clavipes]|nr:hypothetical protein TNCV_2037491 [Trichonephila clavipes]